MSRILVHIFIFVAVIAFPWWISLGMILLASLFFKGFFEGLVWIALLSLLYDAESPKFWFIICSIAYIIFVYTFETFVRPKLKI